MYLKQFLSSCSEFFQSISGCICPDMDCNYPAVRCCYLLCHMGFPISSINGCDAEAAKRTRDLRNFILFHDFSSALANREFCIYSLAMLLFSILCEI